MKNNIKYSYDEIFQRNIGVFTPEQQEKIKNLKVAIAGVGGMGGAVAYTLARLGVGEIRMADPEKFEVSNINRQFGSYVDTVDKFKVDAIGDELLRINPFLKLVKHAEALSDFNMNNFVEGVDAVFDGLEFFEIETERMLHETAVKKNKWIFMLQSAFNITTVMSFNPVGVNFEEMFCVDGKPSLELLISKMFPRLPKGYNEADVSRLISSLGRGGSLHLPSYSILTPTSGFFVPEEFVRVVIRNEMPTKQAPDLYLLDLDGMVIEHYINGKLCN